MKIQRNPIYIVSYIVNNRLAIFSISYIWERNLSESISNSFYTIIFFFNAINFYKLVIMYMYRTTIDSVKQCWMKDVVKSRSFTNIKLEVFFESLENKLQLTFVESWDHFFLWSNWRKSTMKVYYAKRCLVRLSISLVCHPRYHHFGKLYRPYKIFLKQ